MCTCCDELAYGGATDNHFIQGSTFRPPARFAIAPETPRTNLAPAARNNRNEAVEKAAVAAEKRQREQAPKKRRMFSRESWSSDHPDAITAAEVGLDIDMKDFRPPKRERPRSPGLFALLVVIRLVVFARRPLILHTEALLVLLGLLALHLVRHASYGQVVRLLGIREDVNHDLQVIGGRCGARLSRSAIVVFAKSGRGQYVVQRAL